MTHNRDVGYDLQSSLLISDTTGQPIAPIVQRLVTGKGSYARYQTKPNAVVKNHLKEFLP